MPSSFCNFWILLILAAVFLRRSFKGVAKYTNVNLFATTGLVYLIGVVTVIILIGTIIIFVAEILQIIAFFSLPDEIQQTAEQQLSKVEPISPS